MSANEFLLKIADRAIEQADDETIGELFWRIGTEAAKREVSGQSFLLTESDAVLLLRGRMFKVTSAEFRDDADVMVLKLTAKHWHDNEIPTNTKARVQSAISEIFTRVLKLPRSKRK